jgi:hypothetical protein
MHLILMPNLLKQLSIMFDINKIAIKSNGTPEHGKQIIDFFKSRSLNTSYLDGTAKDHYYYVDKGHFVASFTLPSGYTEITIGMPTVREVLLGDNDSDLLPGLLFYTMDDGKNRYPYVGIRDDDEKNYRAGDDYDLNTYRICKEIKSPVDDSEFDILSELNNLQFKIEELITNVMNKK